MVAVMFHQLTMLTTPPQEQLGGECYDDKCDVWSLGCLVYELCTLTPPFTASNEKLLAARISDGHIRRLPSCYSAELQTSITYLLQTQVSGWSLILSAPRLM